MSSSHAVTWQDLNDRQRAYLVQLYQLDQAAERDERGAFGRGGRPRPAAEWRWIEYGPRELPAFLNYHPELRRQLSERQLVDQGAGATWSALKKRGLVLLKEQPLRIGRWRGSTLFVQLTRQGRQLARVATGEKAPSRLPKGTLRERQWAALARLYGAGEAGILNLDLTMTRGGFAWVPTLIRLARYEPQPLIEELERRHEALFPGHQVSDWYYRITPAGRAFYEREWTRYRELYPEIDAPQPAAEVHP